MKECENRYKVFKGLKRTQRTIGGNVVVQQEGRYNLLNYGKWLKEWMGLNKSMSILFELEDEEKVVTCWHVPLLKCIALKISMTIFPFLEGNNFEWETNTAKWR